MGKSIIFELSFCVLMNKDACLLLKSNEKTYKRNIHVERIINKEISF